MGFGSDQSVVIELRDFINNDGDLHRQQHQPIRKNLMTKLGQGRFNAKLAVKLFMYLVDAGAKKYSKDHGGTWHESFPKAVRLKVAKELLDEFVAEAKLGNYDDLIPKKFQGKVSGKDIREDAEGELSEVSVLADIARMESDLSDLRARLDAISEATGSTKGYAALPGLQRTAQYVQDTVYLSKKMHEAFKANDEAKAKSHMRGMLAALELGLKGMGIEEASHLVSKAKTLVK